MSCCPPGSTGPALLSEQVAEGEIVNISYSNTNETSTDVPPPMNGYWTGASMASSPKHVVIICTDVYGLEFGNHKVFADKLAHELGSEKTVVLIPDLFRGNPIAQPLFPSKPDIVSVPFFLPSMLYRIKVQNKPQRILSDLHNLIIPWIESKLRNNKQDISWSCVGFCFGGWVMARAVAPLEELPFQCGVGIHPSFKPEIVHSGSQTKAVEGIGTRPVLLLPGSNDYDMKPNSHIVNALAKARKLPPEEVSVEFPTMKHGWVTRGNSENEEISKQQQEAIKLAVAFIQKHA